MKKSNFYSFYTVSSWDGAMKPLYFKGDSVTTKHEGDLEYGIYAKTKTEAKKKFAKYKNRLKDGSTVRCFGAKDFSRAKISIVKY